MISAYSRLWSTELQFHWWHQSAELVQTAVVCRAPVPLVSSMPVASMCWVSSNSRRFRTSNYPQPRFNNHFYCADLLASCATTTSQPRGLVEVKVLKWCSGSVEGHSVVWCLHCTHSNLRPAPPLSTASHPSGILVSIFVYSARAGSSECSLTFRLICYLFREITFVAIYVIIDIYPITVTRPRIGYELKEQLL